MGNTVSLSRDYGGAGGFRGNLPLRHELDDPILDAADLELVHPLLAIRMRLFLDWHLASGHAVSVVPPTAPAAAQRLSDLGLAAGLPAGVAALPPQSSAVGAVILPVRHLASFHDVEDAAAEAADLLGQQAAGLATWGDAVHMAIGELCDNALQHGRNEHGAYVAADRTEEPRRFRLAVGDLGIGIPEHVRAEHPEWHDDSAAIGQAMQRGVSGTGDHHRGNGFSEVFDAALDAQLVRAQSALHLEVRSGKGGLTAALVGGSVSFDETPAPTRQPRRGAWITYVVTSV